MTHIKWLFQSYPLMAYFFILLLLLPLKNPAVTLWLMNEMILKVWSFFSTLLLNDDDNWIGKKGKFY